MTSYPAVSALSMIASGSGDSPGTESTTPRPGLAALAAAAAGRTGATPRGHPDSDDIGGNRKPSVAFTPTTEDHTAASCQSSSRVFYPALAAVSSWATTRNSHMQSVPALSAAAALTPLAVSECIVVADKSRRKSQAIELERAKSLHRKSIAMLVPYALPALAHPGSTLTNPSSHTALSAVAQMFAAKVRLSIPDQSVPSGPFAANHTALNTLFHAAPPGMQARKVMSSLKSASVELAPVAPSPRTPKSPSAMTSDGVDPTTKTGNAHGEQGAAGATNDNSGNSGNNNGSFPDGQARSADDGQSTTQLDAFSPTSMSAVAGSPRPMDFASPVRAMPRAIGNMMSPGDESLALGAGRDDNAPAGDDGDLNGNDVPSRAAGSTGAANGGQRDESADVENDADSKKERGLTGETQAWLSAVNGPAVRACVSLALEASNVNQRDKTGQTPRVPSTTSSQVVMSAGSQNAAPYTALRCLGEASRAKALPRTGAELAASIEDRHVRSTSPISRNAIPVPHPSSGVLGMMVQEVKRQEVEEEREKQASMAAKGMHPPPSIAEDKYPALEGIATLMAQSKLRGAPTTSSSTTKGAVSNSNDGAKAHQHDIPTTKEATAAAAEEHDIGSLEVVIAAATAKTSQGQLPGLSSLEAASRSQSVDPEHSANANVAIDIAPSAAAKTTVSNTAGNAGPSTDAEGVASPGSSAPDAKPLAPTPPPRREPSVDVSPRRENGATEEVAKVATRQEDVMVQRGGQTITTATVGVAKRDEPQRHEEAVQHKSATLETHTVETTDSVHDTHGNAGGQNDDGSHLYVEEKLNKLDPNRPPSAVFNYRAKPTGEGLQRVFTSTLRHMARHAMAPDAFLGLHLLHSATMDVKRSEPHKYIAIDPQIVWPGDDQALSSSMLGASSLAPMATAATPASPNAAMNQQQGAAGGKASPPLRNTTTKVSPARPPMGAPGFPGGRSLQNSLSPMRGTIGGAASLLRGSVGRSRTGAGLGVGGALPDTAPEIGSNAPARPPHLPPLSESAAAVALRMKAEAAAQQSDNTRSSTAPQPPAGPPPRLTTAKRIDRRLAKLKSELSVLEEVQKMRRAQVQQNAKARVAKNRHLAPLVAAQRLKQQQQLQQQQQAQQHVLSGTTSPLQQAISPNGTLGAQGASAGGGVGASGSPLKQLSPTGASPGPVSPKGGIFRELHEQKMLEQQLTPPSTGRVSLRSGSGPAPAVAGEGSLGDAVAAS